MILSVLLYSFIVLFAIQLLHYFAFSSLLFKGRERKFKESDIPVSLIIYTKNAEAYLKENIHAFLEQDYSNYELLILNNASIDDTADFLEEIAAKHPKVKLINVENNEAFWGSKKYALTLGIKAAKHNHLVFSDAKAKPNSEFWLSNIASEFSENKQVIISHVSKNAKHPVLNTLIRFVNITNALKSLSFANFGFAFKADSYNIAYTKEAFFKVNGFINHMKIRNGESDLFLKDVSTKKNTTVCLTTNSIVNNQENYTFSSWIKEIKEQNQLKKKYKFGYQFFLTLFNVSRFLFLVLTMVCFFFFSWKLILPFLLTYYLAQFIIVGIASKRFKEPLLLIFLPFLEITSVLIQISIFIAGSLSKPKY